MKKIDYLAEGDLVSNGSSTIPSIIGQHCIDAKRYRVLVGLQHIPGYIDAPVQGNAFAAAGILSGICYRKFLFPFGVSIAALILFIIVYGLVKPAVCVVLRISYKFTDYLNDTVVSIWPGLLLCIFLIPLILAFLRKVGAVQSLHRDLDYSR